ncbi:MAG: hypothetical protein OXC30_02785 [Alphaproteobacteria bacterium]|nr:hypothetical protein [Alphaproteobacteria bacterium]
MSSIFDLRQLQMLLLLCAFVLHSACGGSDWDCVPTLETSSAQTPVLVYMCLSPTGQANTLPPEDCSQHMVPQSADLEEANTSSPEDCSQDMVLQSADLKKTKTVIGRFQTLTILASNPLITELSAQLRSQITVIKNRVSQAEKRWKVKGAAPIKLDMPKLNNRVSQAEKSVSVRVSDPIRAEKPKKLGRGELLHLLLPERVKVKENLAQILKTSLEGEQVRENVVQMLKESLEGEQVQENLEQILEESLEGEQVRRILDDEQVKKYLEYIAVLNTVIRNESALLEEHREKGRAYASTAYCNKQCAAEESDVVALLKKAKFKNIGVSASLMQDLLRIQTQEHAFEANGQKIYNQSNEDCELGRRGLMRERLTQEQVKVNKELRMMQVNKELMVQHVQQATQRYQGWIARQTQQARNVQSTLTAQQELTAQQVKQALINLQQQQNLMVQQALTLQQDLMMQKRRWEANILGVQNAFSVEAYLRAYLGVLSEAVVLASDCKERVSVNDRKRAQSPQHNKTAEHSASAMPLTGGVTTGEMDLNLGNASVPSAKEAGVDIPDCRREQPVLKQERRSEDIAENKGVFREWQSCQDILKRAEDDCKRLCRRDMPESAKRANEESLLTLAKRSLPNRSAFASVNGDEDREQKWQFDETESFPTTSSDLAKCKKNCVSNS